MMRLRRVGLVAVLGCAFVSIVAALGAVMTETNAPGWAIELFILTMVGNAFVVASMWRSGWTWKIGVGSAAVGVGIINIAVWQLLRTFSLVSGSGIEPRLFYQYSLARPIFYLVVPGMLMGAIGIWFLDVNEWRTILTSNRRTIATLIVVFLGMVVFVELTVGLAIIPFLWAHLTGLYLIPVVVVGAIRWSRHLPHEATIVMWGSVSLLVVALVLPQWLFVEGGTLLGCPPENWANSLQYSVDWTRKGGRAIGWSDGCNSRWLRPITYDG